MENLNDFKSLLDFVGTLSSTVMAGVSGIVKFLTTDISKTSLFSGLLQTLLDRLGIIDFPDLNTGITVLHLMSGGVVIYLGYSLIKWILDIIL